MFGSLFQDLIPSRNKSWKWCRAVSTRMLWQWQYLAIDVWESDMSVNSKIECQKTGYDTEEDRRAQNIGCVFSAEINKYVKLALLKNEAIPYSGEVTSWHLHSTLTAETNELFMIVHYNF